MRKTLGLLVVLVLFLAGCSDDGTLKITNEALNQVSFTINDGAEEILDSGNSYSKSWELSTSIFSNEEKDVTIDYGFDGVLSHSVTKTVEAGSTTKFEIESEDGTLLINNLTSREVWFTINDETEITLDVGESYSKSWELLEDDIINVDVAYAGFHVFYDEVEVPVEAGNTTTLHINADGGAIEIWNNSAAFYIEEVYITASDDPNWGENRITVPIGPDESYTWTVTPGDWDVQVVDNWGDVFESLENYIALDQTTFFEYTGFKKVDKPAGGMKTEIYTGTSREESKIERKK